MNKWIFTLGLWACLCSFSMAFTVPSPLKKRVHGEWFTMGYGSAIKFPGTWVYGKNVSAYYHSAFGTKHTMIRSGIDFIWKEGVYRNMWNVNVSWGKWTTSGRILWSATIGPSLQAGRTFNRTRMITLGATSHAGFTFKVAQDVGLGFELYSHFNLFQPATGFRVVLSGIGQ